MRKRLLLRRDARGLSSLFVVLAVVAAALVASAFVLYPWLTRGRDYANEPNNPEWMGRFEMTVTLKVLNDRPVAIDIRRVELPLEGFDGEPWSTLSLASFLPGEEYILKYDIELTKGDLSRSDSGILEVEKDDYYRTTAKSRWFFFQEEEQGAWSYELTVSYRQSIQKSVRGTLTIEDGKVV